MHAVEHLFCDKFWVPRCRYCAFVAVRRVRFGSRQGRGTPPKMVQRRAVHRVRYSRVVLVARLFEQRAEFFLEFDAALCNFQLALQARFLTLELLNLALLSSEL